MRGIAVLFVCTGNICRSPTAEGVFRRLARERGLAERIEIASAGTHGYHVGDPPDARAVRMAASRGDDISGLRARHLEARDFHSYDLLVALDAGHLSCLERMDPGGGRGRPVLLMSFAPGAGSDVPDPYYGTDKDFALAYDLIERGSAGLIDHVAAMLEAR